MNHFVTKQISIYFPYEAEVPHELLALGGLQQPLPAELPPFIRVAKFEERVIGVYLLETEDGVRFSLESLAVEEAFRGRGLGSWLVGHAIGVAESKGGRRVWLPESRYTGSLFDRLGFAREASIYELEITPEN